MPRRRIARTLWLAGALLAAAAPPASADLLPSWHGTIEAQRTFPGRSSATTTWVLNGALTMTPEGAVVQQAFWRARYTGSYVAHHDLCGSDTQYGESGSGTGTGTAVVAFERWGDQWVYELGTGTSETFTVTTTACNGSADDPRVPPTEASNSGNAGACPAGWTRCLVPLEEGETPSTVDTLADTKSVMVGSALYTVTWNLTRRPQRLTVTPRLIDGSPAGEDVAQTESDPVGIDCPTRCLADFAPNEPVTLSAKAQPGYLFDHWEGDCQGTSPVCVVRMDGPRSVAPVYRPRPACYRTDAVYDVRIIGGRAVGTSETTVNWCTDFHAVTLSGPVAHGMPSVGAGWFDELLSRLGLSYRYRGDWRPTDVSGEGTPAVTVRTFPELTTCVDLLALAKLVPVWRTYGFGTAAWRVLPGGLKDRLIGSGLVWTVWYLANSTSASRAAFEWLVKRIPRAVIKAVADGISANPQWCDDTGDGIKATVTVTLAAGGSATDSVDFDRTTGFEWTRNTGSQTVEIGRRSALLTTPGGKVLAFTDVPSAGRVTARVERLRGTAGAAAARRPVVLAAVTRRVKRAGAVRIALRPTRAGRAQLRRKGTVAVRLRTIFKPPAGKRQVTVVRASFGIPPARRGD